MNRPENKTGGVAEVLRVLGTLLMVGGAAVFGWQQYLDWSDNYSRRGMEALVYLIMWGIAGGSVLLGIILRLIGGRLVKGSPEKLRPEEADNGH